MYKLMIILMVINTAHAKKDCKSSMKAKSSAEKLAELYTLRNADPNLQKNGSSRIDHVIYSKEVILKLKSQP